MNENPKLYLETTIPGNLAAFPSRDLIVAAHQQITHDWWEKARFNFGLYISEAVLNEIEIGDQKAASRRLIFVQNLPALSLNNEVVKLANDYATQLGLLSRAKLDVLHLVFAVEYEMDYLLTWNKS